MTTAPDNLAMIPPPGIWAPAVTLFDPSTDRLIPPDQIRYYRYLASTGLSGLVILGTNAEAFLLTREERTELISLARRATGPGFPLMAGCGGHSTRQVLEFISDAAAAGANYALVLPPAYFGKATSAAVIGGFFAEVAEKSSLPIVIYNFPAVCNGVDLDSATITSLVKRFPGKIVGVKLTCGSVAKITRLAAELPPSVFATFGGQSDFLLGGLAVGSSGCIAAFANVFPRTIVEIYNLWEAGRHADALALHQKAALAEQSCKSGIAAVKYAASVYTAPRAIIHDAEEKMQPRRPYLPMGAEAKAKLREATREVALLEADLVRGASHL